MILDLFCLNESGNKILSYISVYSTFISAAKISSINSINVLTYETCCGSYTDGNKMTSL